MTGCMIYIYGGERKGNRERERAIDLCPGAQQILVPCHFPQAQIALEKDAAKSKVPASAATSAASEPPPAPEAAPSPVESKGPATPAASEPPPAPKAAPVPEKGAAKAKAKESKGAGTGSPAPKGKGRAKPVAKPPAKKKQSDDNQACMTSFFPFREESPWVTHSDSSSCMSMSSKSLRSLDCGVTYFFTILSSSAVPLVSG